MLEITVTFCWLLEKFDLVKQRSTGLYANKLVSGTTKEAYEAHRFTAEEAELAAELARKNFKPEEGMEWRFTEHGFH